MVNCIHYISDRFRTPNEIPFAVPNQSEIRDSDSLNRISKPICVCPCSVPRHLVAGSTHQQSLGGRYDLVNGAHWEN